MPTAAPFFITLLVVGLAAFVSALIFILPAARLASTKAAPGFPVIAESFQPHVSKCRPNFWHIATDERLRSNLVFAQAQSIPDERGLSFLVASYGQLVDHELVLSNQDSVYGNFTLQMIPTNSVLTLRRNIHRNNTVTGCRESRNFNTPWIDGTVIYGDFYRPTRIDQLRDGTSCSMRTSEGNLLPIEDGMFQAGEDRVTEHSFLTSLHTLWMREHNRLCGVLRASEPDWTEEERFWKARQLVVAKFQRITYEEWLPALLGTLHITENVRIKHEFRESIVSEFSVAAYRFGHSMIPDPIGPFRLPMIFFNSSVIQSVGIEPLLQAALQTKAERVDHFVIDGLRDFMFAAGPGVMGEDLITRNLFRARDVGLATYADVKQAYAAGPPTDPTELETFVGLLSEPVHPGSSVPYTIGVIINEQFQRLRQYDPNHYERIATRIGARYWPEVKQATIAKLIRDNTGLTASAVQDNAFFV